MRLFFSTLLLFFSIADAYEINGKAIHVADGDTITILDSDHSKNKIRLSGIDAPEKRQPFGDKAKKMLVDMVKGKQVTAICTVKDRYKRDICTVYYNDSDINAEMVANGGAWVYRKYYKGSEYYTLENSAKDQKLGLWNTSEYEAIAPWKWRRK